MQRHGERSSIVVLLLVVVLGLAVTATFSVGRAYRSLAHPGVDHPERPAFVTAPDPILRSEKGLEPNSTDIAPGISQPDVRTIQVFDGRIALLEGGQLRRVIRFDRLVATPADIVDAVGDPGWIRASAADEVVIDAALVMQPGTSLLMRAPLRRIVLQTQPGVFLGGNEAMLSFDGVTVEASDRSVPGDGEVGPGNRPFVVAQGGGMEIRGSSFRYLGRDWNDSYGVAWTKGATGSAVDSTFEHNFMGIFAATAIDVRFAGNTLRDNTLNGFTAYELSAGLTFERNVVEGNGRGGVVLSSHVTRAAITKNTVQANGFDGIMAIDHSDENTITDNLAENNGGDGVLIADSTGNTVDRNTVRNNRVAISAYGDGADTNVARGNTIDDNGLATQGLSGEGNVVLSNGDYWRPAVLITIWVLAVVVFGVLLLLTRRSQRNRLRVIATPHQAQHRSISGAV